MFIRFPKLIVSLFFVLSVAGVFLAINRVQFEFNFEQFFPEGDEDLKFFLEFKERFEPDDNFVLVGIKREEGVFEQEFLEQVLAFSLEARRMNFEISTTDSIDHSIYTKAVNSQGDSIVLMHPILSAQSLLQIEYPVKNPFTGFSTIPALHLEDTARYAKDQKKILADERLVGNFISEDAKTLVVVLKTVDNIQQGAATLLIQGLKDLVKKYEFKEYHLLGRAYFQTEIVKLQVKEFILSSAVSFLLVFLVLFFLFKRFWGIVIALVSILVGLFMFVGMLGLFARTLDTMALLYPIIMIIVATSDVIHVMSKYIDELQKGQSKMEAIQVTIREIGMSIFLTSTTTALGFFSLVTSRLIPIQEFGVNAAFGVMIAYISVVVLSTTILALFDKEQIIKLQDGPSVWTKWMEWIDRVTKSHQGPILAGFAVLLVVCTIGIAQISTNTQFLNLLPKNNKVTEDFLFFEEEFSGFRPFEIAISIQGDYTINDYEVIQEISKIEEHFKEYPAIKSMSSITNVYKSINQAHHVNNPAAYVMPKDLKEFKKYQRSVRRISQNSNLGILVSKDKKHTRISAKVLDIGANNIDSIRIASKQWIAEHIDPNIIQTRSTGTGIILDKNSNYIRDSLLQGLLLAILTISIIVAFIYRNVKMLILTLIPNMLPLLIAAAILGFAGIPLEAGVAIVFAIIFGIAIDDTIHLLSKFKLTKDKGYSTDEAIKITLLETGKAICLTTVILFFGFLSLLLSSNPPAITIGILISSTLVSALICDLLIIPIMLRKWIK
ncbi:efflux RND transporter permease subunit [Aureispira anguillae]|uniref:MMPL family transporter n=1 Tax=Aureispira anguillae TaxID=2864201 RepID=A0A915YEY8_9BACT|nr:MMPL family transporter [Aureispira anguillae]BDS11894.1 MMPL family transporter [Aureispira anguillae]